MTVPSNAVYVTGQGAISGDQLNTFQQACSTAPALRTFIGKSNMMVTLLGIASVGDGAGGMFYWNSTATGPDDNFNVIQPNGVTVGAWVRLSVQTTGSRIPLLSPLTLYVSPTGSDSNNGLTALTPFATWQKAVFVAVVNYDTAGQNITVLGAAGGTYAQGFFMSQQLTGGGGIFFAGNGSTLTVSGQNGLLAVNPAVSFGASGFTISVSGAGYGAVVANNGAFINVGNDMTFGTCTTVHIAAYSRAGVSLNGYTISGDTDSHWACSGGEIFTANQTITLSGSRTFSQFVAASNCGRVISTNTTFSGTNSAGLTVNVNTNSVVNTNGALNIPGSGQSLGSGGQYV